MENFKRPIEILLKLIDMAYWWGNRMPNEMERIPEKDRKPGFLISRLDKEDRQVLQNLKSEDLAEEKLQKDATNMAILTSRHYENQELDKKMRNTRLEFDKKLKLK